MINEWETKFVELKRKSMSRWEITLDGIKILSATGREVFGRELKDNWKYFSSDEYGEDIIKYIKLDGLSRVVYLLKGTQ